MVELKNMNFERVEVLKVGELKINNNKKGKKETQNSPCAK